MICIYVVYIYMYIVCIYDVFIYIYIYLNIWYIFINMYIYSMLWFVGVRSASDFWLFRKVVREAKVERAELRATVKDLLQSSSEAELPRHAAQVMQAGRRDMGGLWPKTWEIVGFFMGKKHGKTMGILWLNVYEPVGVGRTIHVARSMP